MPYIITTTPRPTHNQLVARIDGMELPCTRTAVATLDEARTVVRGALTERSPKHATPTAMEAIHDQADDIFAHDGTGQGTVGPLPDGTVIEVRRVTYADLIADAPDGQLGKSQPAILAAYNAR